MMQAIANIGLSNAAVAVLLAVLVFVVTRFWRSPALAHALWLLVLLKFIAPPLVGVALKLPVADTQATPPVDVTAVPPVETLTATPIEIPSEPPEDLPGGIVERMPDDGFSSGGTELPEPSPALEPFDPWIPSGSPTPPDQALPAELPSESLAAAPLVTDDEALDEAHDETELLLDAPLANAPVQSAPGQSIDLSRETRVDTAIETRLENPSLAIAFNFDSVWPYAAGVWLAGAVVWFVAVGVRLRRFGKLLKRTDAAPDALRDEVARLAEQIGLRSAPDVRLVDAAIPPLAWAMFGRPLLLLPRELIGRLDADERLTLLAHELAHLRRRDHLTRWLEIVVLGLYWWQPVAWFARRQLHCAAEQCCDAWVVRRFPEHARDYAQALFKTVEFLADADATLPLGATGFSQANLLERRFAMILQGRRTDRLSRTVRYGLLLLGLVILPLSIRSLWADEQTPGNPVPAAEPAAAPQIWADAAKDVPMALPAVPPVGAPTPAPAAAAAPQAPMPHLPPTLAPMAVPPTPKLDPHEIFGQIERPEDGSSSNIDKRLSRLESTVETLVRELRARPIEPRPPVAYPHPGDRYAHPRAIYGPPTTVPSVAPEAPYGPQSMPNAAPAYNQATPRARSSRSVPQKQSAPNFAPQPELPSTGVTLPPRDARLEDPQSSAPPTDGPVPQVASAPMSTLPAPPTPDRYAVEVSGEEKELRQDVEGNIEDRLEEPLVDLKKQVELCETNKNRVLAARERVIAVDEAYKRKPVSGTLQSGTLHTSLDMVLEAQRQLAAAEVEYAGSLAKLKKLTAKSEKEDNSDRLVALANFRAAANAKSQALETWRHVHALFEKGARGGEVEKETQAREQYFLFKEQTEKALAALRSSYHQRPIYAPSASPTR